MLDLITNQELYLNKNSILFDWLDNDYRNIKPDNYLFNYNFDKPIKLDVIKIKVKKHLSKKRLEQLHISLRLREELIKNMDFENLFNKVWFELKEDKVESKPETSQ